MRVEQSLAYFKRRRDAMQLMEEDDAIWALEKQIPKKLKTIKVGLSGSVLLCPSCENEVAMICDSVWRKGRYKQKYCDNCGQALDWNDLKGETK